MRAPLSEIEPERLGVSMCTRGEAVSAASRVMVWAGTLPAWLGACGTAPGAGGLCGSLAPGVCWGMAGGCWVCACCWICFCLSMCGTP